jgi:hypothetical protein
LDPVQRLAELWVSEDEVLGAAILAAAQPALQLVAHRVGHRDGPPCRQI